MDDRVFSQELLDDLIMSIRTDGQYHFPPFNKRQIIGEILDNDTPYYVNGTIRYTADHLWGTKVVFRLRVKNSLSDGCVVILEYSPGKWSLSVGNNSDYNNFEG